MSYWILKYLLLGPILRLVYRPRATGLENVPETGPAILASNHLSFIDSLFIPLLLKRRVVFLGKSEYFDSWRTRWFVRSVGVIPVRRAGGADVRCAAPVRAVPRPLPGQVRAAVGHGRDHVRDHDAVGPGVRGRVR